MVIMMMTMNLRIMTYCTSNQVIAKEKIHPLTIDRCPFDWKCPFSVRNYRKVLIMMPFTAGSRPGTQVWCESHSMDGTDALAEQASSSSLELKAIG